ncbi:MAG: PAS domain S-box protein [Candidatus Glassbacteria bacterium]|nr:PAS domain S-box protein [Candidatus Glassbacteria bacterium]
MASLTTNKVTLLRLVLQTSSEAIVLLDSGGMILGASLKLTGLLRTTWQELVGHPFTCIAPQELNDQKLCPPPEGKQRLTIVDTEGNRILSSWMLVPWYGDEESGGKKLIAAYLIQWYGEAGTGRDSFLDEVVREFLTDSLPLGVMVTDRTGKIVLYNRGQERITGITAEEAMGKMLFADYAAAAPDEIKRKFRQALKEPVEMSLHEFDYTDRRGITRRFRGRVSTLMGPDGEIHGAVQTLEDVSRPAQLKQEIDRTRGFLTRLLETTPNPIFTTDMSGRLTFTNRAADDVLGLHERTAEGPVTAGDIFLGGEREAGQIISYLAERDGSVEDYETYLNCGNSEVPASLTMSYLYDEDGNPEGVISIVRTLSRERKLQSEIRRNEHYLAAFIDNSTDAVIVLDEEAKVKTWNQGAEKMFGYSKDKMLGKPLDGLVPPEDEVVKSSKMGRVEFTSDGKLKHYSTDLVNARGERLVVESTSTELNDQYGGITGRLIIFRDVTLRDRLEEILKENIADLSRINEISEALLTSKDLDETLGIILIGVTASQGLGFNRAFLLLVDHDEGALVGKLAIGPSDASEAGRIWNEVHSKYQTLRDLFKAYKQSGLDRDSHVNRVVRNLRFPLADDSNPLIVALKEKKSLNVVNGVDMGVLSPELAAQLNSDTLAVVPLVCEYRSVGLLIADNMINNRPIDEEAVSMLRMFANLASQTIERSRLYQSLEEKIQALNTAYRDLKESRNKLVQAERLSALGQLATHVAHEIRNPLVSIGGFARYLAHELPDGDPAREKADVIVEETDRLERYLKDTLTYMRHNNPVFRPADPNRLVKDTFMMMDAELEESGVELVDNLMPNPPEVELDADQIRQVLLNVFRNALEAMPEGGTLTVSSRLEGDMFTLSAADTGVGVSDQERDKLFTAFFTTKSSGSGLGLTICSQIVNNHRGKITVESNDGPGTVFHITLPVTQADFKEAEHEEIADRR